MEEHGKDLKIGDMWIKKDEYEAFNKWWNDRRKVQELHFLWGFPMDVAEQMVHDENNTGM